MKVFINNWLNFVLFSYPFYLHVKGSSQGTLVPFWHQEDVHWAPQNVFEVVVVVVVVYFILSRLLYLAFSANLGLLCMLHPGMGPLV